MQDRWYLLSLEWEMQRMIQGKQQSAEPQEGQQIEKLQAGKSSIEEIIRLATPKLDCERQKRLESVRRGRKRLECIGAGLLLQLAVREALDETAAPRLRFLTLSQLLQEAKEPLPLEYCYGSRGKPYLQNYPFFFNLSHSGMYVLCVLSRREIGADIQWKASQVNERVLKRFFSPREKAHWESCGTEEEKRDFFYRMWCRKEAYGKLTGEGIGAAVSADMDAPGLPVVIEEYEDLKDYQISVCSWMESSFSKT